eukprot:Sdes_comp21158_c0_seq1m19829
MAAFEVFFTDPAFIVPSIFHSWIQGLNLEKAAKLEANQQENSQATLSLWASEVSDQYNLFVSLEHFLHFPKYFPAQCLFQITAELRREIIEKYYGFDEQLYREIMGKKLNARVKKEFDDTCEKHSISLQSARRQFENLKRIVKIVEEMDGSLVANIQSNFLLSKALSHSYAAIIFLNLNRIECSKKKLIPFNFKDFEFLAWVIMNHWTVDEGPPCE